MFRTIGLAELLVVLGFSGALLLIPAIFYLITLQRALERCAPESRTMPPGQVWLLLIPLFNVVWQFMVVNSIAASLRNEFARRRIPLAETEPGKNVGFVLCISTVAGIVPLVNILAGPVSLVCWILYWVKIAGYSRMLIPPMAIATS
jgi:hypothetical protein